MRKGLPAGMTRLLPKGTRDCGAHEWYNANGRIEHCYHCSVGERRATATWSVVVTTNMKSDSSAEVVERDEKAGTVTYELRGLLEDGG